MLIDGTQIFGVASIVCYVRQLSLGLGKPVHELEGDVIRYAQLLQFRFLHQVLVVTALGLAKISICLWLLPLASRAVPKYLLSSLRCGIIFMIAFTIASALTIVGEPFPLFWSVLSANHPRCSRSSSAGRLQLRGTMP